MGKHERQPSVDPDPTRPIKKGKPAPPVTPAPPVKKPILPWRKPKG